MENIKAIKILEKAMETMEKRFEAACMSAPDEAVVMLSEKLTDMAEAAAKLYTATCGDKMLQPVVEMLKDMRDRPHVTGLAGDNVES